MLKNRKRKGFTLVELLVVIAILAILMLIAVPKFMDSTKGARVKTFEANFRTLVGQITSYQAEHNGTAGIESDKALTDMCKDLAGKPYEGTTYAISKDALTCTLKKEAFKGTADYVLTYDIPNSEIKPTGNADGLSSFAPKTK